MKVSIDLPPDVVAAIESYINTNWTDGQPSRLGALNAVAFIGERIAAIYAAQRPSHKES
jgi:hypothetical protein